MIVASTFVSTLVRCAPQDDPEAKSQPFLVWLLVCLESWRLAFCALAFHVCWGMCWRLDVFSCATENTYTLFVIYCERCPRPCSLLKWSSFSLWCARVNSLRMISGWIKRGKLITKNVFLSRLIPCVKRQSFVAAQHGMRTSESSQVDWKLWDNLPLQFDSTS